MPHFCRQGDCEGRIWSLFVFVDLICFCRKLVSEVGFEPTPTFVDQNTPVRKSSTLESGALDRSAILTCHYRQGDEYLYSNSVETPKTTTIRSMHVAFILPRTTRGTSSNGRALDSHSRGTGIDTPVLHTKIFFYD